jgi:uncharacterized protein (TIGR02588 family)
MNGGEPRGKGDLAAGGGDPGRTPAHSPPSPWEWAVGALGALLVIATVAFLGYQAAADSGTAPDIVVRVDSVSRTTEGAWRVEFTARNLGGTTAAQVQVHGELRASGAEPETGEVTLDYIPGRGERRAGLLFRGDPRRGLELRARGYDLP